MDVLIACEHSTVVREAFNALPGVRAISCDLRPADDGPADRHIQGDVRQVLYSRHWDLMIAHPPCTFLAASGIHWNTKRPDREDQTRAALNFVLAILNAPVLMIAMENPIGLISTEIRKPDQIIQPWMFGEDASKATCLWLKNLPTLIPTKSMQRPAWIPCPEECDEFWCQRHWMHAYECDCPPIDEWAEGDNPYYQYYANQTPSGNNRVGEIADRAAVRSKTYQGIADAMAAQWGPLLINPPQITEQPRQVRLWQF